MHRFEVEEQTKRATIREKELVETASTSEKAWTAKVEVAVQEKEKAQRLLDSEANESGPRPSVECTWSGSDLVSLCKRTSPICRKLSFLNEKSERRGKLV